MSSISSTPSNRTKGTFRFEEAGQVVWLVCPGVAAPCATSNSTLMATGKRPLAVKQLHLVASILGVPGTVFLPNTAKQ